MESVLNEALIRVVGASLASASFAGDRIRNLEKDLPNCGVDDLMRVLYEYSDLFNLDEMLEPFIGQEYGDYGNGQIPDEIQPDNLHARAVYLG